MKILRVSTKNEVTVHKYPEGKFKYRHRKLTGLIGNDCELYQQVRPKRLYSELGLSTNPKCADCVSMLVDEEGLLKDSEINLVGSYLYETDKHGAPIVGNILFVGERIDEFGEVDMCGISDDVFQTLKNKILKLVDKYRRSNGL